MSLPKGRSNNPDGRPKGAISQKTKDWKEMGEYIKNQLVPQYVDLLDKWLASKDPDLQAEAMHRIEAILEYFQPRLSRVDSNNSGELNLNVKISHNDKPQS